MADTAEEMLGFTPRKKEREGLRVRVVEKGKMGSRDENEKIE